MKEKRVMINDHSNYNVFLAVCCGQNSKERLRLKKKTRPRNKRVYLV